MERVASLAALLKERQNNSRSTIIPGIVPNTLPHSPSILRSNTFGNQIFKFPFASLFSLNPF